MDFFCLYWKYCDEFNIPFITHFAEDWKRKRERVRKICRYLSWKQGSKVNVYQICQQCCLFVPFFSESMTTRNPKSDHFAHFIVFVTGVQSMPTVYCPPIHKYSVHILFGRSHKQRPLSNVHSSHHMVSITAFIIMKCFLPKASDKSKPNSFAHRPMCLSHHHIFPVLYWSAGLVHVFSSSVKMTYPPDLRRVRSENHVKFGFLYKQKNKNKERRIQYEWDSMAKICNSDLVLDNCYRHHKIFLSLNRIS